MTTFFETGNFEELEKLAMDGGESGKFWSMKVSKDKGISIKELALQNCMVHITNASFGVNMKKGTRTVITVNDFPICVLSEKEQSHALDLNFNSEAATEFIFELKGQKVSPCVYLTGYISFDESYDVDDEPMDDDEHQMIEAMKGANSQQKSEQTKGEEEVSDDDDIKMHGDDEEEEVEPPKVEQKKKQKKKKKQKDAVKETPKAPVDVTSDLLRCSICNQHFPPSAFSKSQLRKGEKRKSKQCIAKMQNKK